MSADGWSTFGLRWPNRARYQTQVDKFLGSIKNVLPNELRLIVAEYASSLVLHFHYPNRKVKKIEFHHITIANPISYLSDMTMDLYIKFICINASVTTPHGYKIDLLSDGYWHDRGVMCCTLAKNKKPSGLPHDAYAIVDFHNNEYTPKQSIDKCIGEVWVAYCHDTQKYTVEMDFNPGML